MKFAIDCGHNCVPNSGARGIIFEDDATRAIGVLVIQKLKDLGHTVIDVTPYGQKFNSVSGALGVRCKKANDNNVDMLVCIHLNAFNKSANGTEVFAISESAKKIAKPVLDELVKLGFKNRGVKQENLYMLRNTKAPAILVEVCFCDSPIDMQIYDPEKAAFAIVKGLVGEPIKVDPPKEIPKSTVVRDNTMVLVQTMLNTLHIPDDNWHPLTEDGDLGPRTVQATKRAQGILGLTVDGIPGPSTISALKEIVSKPLIKAGSKNIVCTRYIQYRLGIKADGIFGPNTESVVKKYQTSYKLSADGIVGTNTWNKLL